MRNRETLVTDWSILKNLFNQSVPFELLNILDKLVRDNKMDVSKITDFETMNKVKILYTQFMNRFYRIPNVFPIIVSATEALNVECVVSNFNVKSMKYALTIDELDIQYQVFLSLAFGNQIYDVVNKLRKHKKDIYNFVGGLPSIPFQDDALKQWIISHVGTTSNITIHSVARLWNQPNFPKGETLLEMKAFAINQRATIEWELAKQKYPVIFDQPFECSIRDTPYKINNEQVQILDANDKLQIMLGVLTVCCQRLDGTGEACMMEGLINPESGFLVFRRGSKVLAQSWIWLTEDQTCLVLDNIELADGRKTEDIFDLLFRWSKQSTYKNIQMGTGFNRVKIGLPVQQEEMQWYKQMWKFKYTDAYQRVWIKKNGEMSISSEEA
ncbi:hypothetical protein [Peribacillus alkalitolerans]|uniref:hypothetical protein n=1 Tax=Peribacillus alkalitolerans TaxID=1550385 RepID=UPI0013D119C4|nr:hypothetical protein [Peribacillus alkalitolerans]